jgi:2-methylcitrate dehydratase PrpD
MKNPLIALAEHAAGWRGRAIEPDVEHHARRALVDWFAALIAGCAHPPATLLARALPPDAGAAICYVDGTRGGTRRAALLNAVASHTVEFDDIHRDSGFHPGCPTIPSALAVAQSRGADMHGLLRGIIAGYEVGCRIGMAVQPSHYRYWHTTGTVGTFGAAAAASVMLGSDAERTAHALATAATMAGGLQQAFRGAGMSKPMHTGHAAEAGTLAALAAHEGVTGALDVLDGPVGFAAATSEDRGKWDKALATLGSAPVITGITFKNHGCCGHIFAALDGLRALQEEAGFSVDDIERIAIGGYGPTKEICDRPDPRTEQEARFSAQYCSAALLLLGGVRLAAFSEQRLRDPAIRALAARVSVSLDPELASAYPAKRAARLAVTLRDGRELTRHQDTRKGDPEWPLTDAELSAKFLELAAPVLGDAASGQLLAALWKGAEVPGEFLVSPGHRR